jgi:hypothetical protein
MHSDYGVACNTYVLHKLHYFTIKHIFITVKCAFVVHLHYVIAKVLQRCCNQNEPRAHAV